MKRKNEAQSAIEEIVRKAQVLHARGLNPVEAARQAVKEATSNQ